MAPKKPAPKTARPKRLCPERGSLGSLMAADRLDAASIRLLQAALRIRGAERSVRGGRGDYLTLDAELRALKELADDASGDVQAARSWIAGKRPA